MSKLEVKEIAPISGETELKLGQSGGAVTIEGDVQTNSGIKLNDTNPHYLYSVGASQIGVRFNDGATDTGYMWLKNFAPLVNGIGVSSGILAFATESTERMRIDANGNLLVGTTNTTPGYFNTETGISALYPGRLFISQNEFSTWNQNQLGTVVSWKYQSADVGNIAISASATSYNTSSDYRLKENVQPLTGGIDRLKQLKPSHWTWVQNGEYGEGFVAHEAKQVVPLSVTGEKDGMRSEEYEITPAVFNDEGVQTTAAVMGTREVPEYQGIDHSKLVPLLTSALQEAVAKIESLEERVAALEAN